MKSILLLLSIFVSLLTANELEKISLQLKWKYQFQFAGFIVAKEKGFYSDLGLDVELKELGDNTKIVDDVISGKLDFAVSDSSLIYEALVGKPLVAMMSIFQQTPFVLIALKNSGIQKVEDIDQHKIALYEGIDGISIRTMLEANRVQYIVKPPLFDIEKLKSGEVDLMAAYISNEPYVAQLKNIDIITFSPQDYGFEGYGDILFTSKKLLNERPQLVKNIRSATYRGWIYAYNHIDEVVDLIYERFNTLHKTKDSLRYEAMKLKELSGYGTNFGLFDEDRIKSIAQLFNLLKHENNLLRNLDDFIYQKDFKLKKGEEEYLKNKKKISLCVDSNNMPFEDFDPDGRYIGLTSSYFKIFEKNLKIPIEVIETKSRKESLFYIQKNSCDIISTIKSQKTQTVLNFTKEYFSEPLVIATELHRPFIDDFKHLTTEKIGIPKGYTYKQALQQLYPNMNLIEVPSIKEGLNLVKEGKLYGQIGTLATISYHFQQEFPKELKIAGKTDNVHLKLAIGVNKNNPQLLNILEQQIDTLDDEDHYSILHKWISIKHENRVIYKYLWQVIFIFLLILSIISLAYYRQKKLENKIIRINKNLEQKINEAVEKNRQQELLMLQQHRLAQMGEMISMIAHQWRQPLNTLALVTQSMLLKYKLGKLNDTIVQEFDNVSHMQIQGMSKTIDDFRSFFKPEKEKIDFCINDVVLHALNILQPTLSTTDLMVTFSDSVPLYSHGYPRELGHAIINLLNNSKYALVTNNILEKRVDIFLKAVEDKIILQLSDNGQGIPLNIIDKIFDPYFSTKTERNGTGLGLYMTKIIIEDHMNGRISVSNIKNGILFEIILQKQ